MSQQQINATLQTDRTPDGDHATIISPVDDISVDPVDHDVDDYELYQTWYGSSNKG